MIPYMLHNPNGCRDKTWRISPLRPRFRQTGENHQKREPLYDGKGLFGPQNDQIAVKMGTDFLFYHI